VICSQANRARVYRCRDGCGRLSRRQADVDELVTKVIVERLRRPDVASLVARGRGGEVQALESQAVALRSRLDSLAGLFAKGVIDAQQLTEGTKEINSALAQVRSQIGRVYDGSALAGIIDTDDAGSAWLEAPLDRKRAVLDALATVTLLRGGHGRPARWQPGQTYFRPELVKMEWRQS
jgi:site-specific DNA recombinase